MTLARCRTRTTDSRIKVAERGRQVIFLNDARAAYFRTRIDRCMKLDGKAADWIVTKGGLGDVIVELKGRDVDHAVKQIIETAAFWKEKGFCVGQVAAVIICAQYHPGVSTSLQLLMDNFRRRFRARLHVASRNAECVFGDVFKAARPFK